jgi:hypothetical protein
MTQWCQELSPTLYLNVTFQNRFSQAYQLENGCEKTPTPASV